MHNRPLHLRQSSQLSSELDHNRLQIDQALQSRALSYIQSFPDFERVQTGEMTSSVFIEQVVASSPKEISSAVRVMCAVILGAFIMNQGCAVSQTQVQAEKVPNVCDTDKSADREKVLKEVKEGSLKFSSVDESLKKDREIVLAAVEKDGYNLRLADESLKKDREIVLVAVKKDGYNFQFADESLKNDKQFILSAVEQDGDFLEYADESFKKDKEVVLVAIRQKSSAFRFADESLLKDKEVVLALISIGNFSCIYADTSLRGDKDVILAIIKKSGGYFLEYFDESFKKDKDVILALISYGRCSFAFEYADKSLTKDKNFMLEAIRQNSLSIEYTDKSLKKNKKFILAAAEYNVEIFEWADPSVISNSFLESEDFKIKLAAQKIGVDSEVLQSNPIIKTAIGELGNNGYKYHFKDTYWCSEFVFYLFKNNPNISHECGLPPDPLKNRIDYGTKDMREYLGKCDRAIENIRDNPEKMKPGYYISINNAHHSEIFIGWKKKDDGKPDVGGDFFSISGGRISGVGVVERNWQRNVKENDFAGKTD